MREGLLDRIRSVVTMQVDPGVPVLDEAELEEAIVEGDPLVVFFYADWCGFCRAFAPTFAELAERASIEAVGANISDRGDPRWKRYSVDTVPTAIAFADGEVAQRADGRPGMGLEAADVEALFEALEG